MERERAVIAHVRARGLPAVAPLSLPNGHTIHERDGRFYALFPRAALRQGLSESAVAIALLPASGAR